MERCVVEKVSIVVKSGGKYSDWEKVDIKRLFVFLEGLLIFEYFFIMLR